MNIFDALNIINEKLNSNPQLNWAVVGSLATAIQGCEIVPGDIDIWISKDTDIELAVNCFYELLPEDSPITSMNDSWFSTKKQPTVTFQIGNTNWTFGRVYMNDWKIEIAHAIPNDIGIYNPGDGIWENGPDISNLLKFVNFKGQAIPVVPLEVQLQTNLTRGKEKRIKEIIRIFRMEGYDPDLLAYCLNGENYETFLKII